jgi:hypothetical protein
MRETLPLLRKANSGSGVKPAVLKRLPAAAPLAAPCCCRSVFGCGGQEAQEGQEPPHNAHLELLLQQLGLQGSQQQALLAQQASRVCPAPAPCPLLRAHEGRC